MKTGRNDPCPCGSGRKFKHCCIANAAPSPQELLWRRLRRELDKLPNAMLSEATRYFGPTGVFEAWAEFNLWPEGDDSGNSVVDEDSPYAQLFASWFIYDWLPDPYDTKVPDRAREITAAMAYLQRKAAHLSPIQRAYIESCSAAAFSFHEILKCEPGRGFRLCDVLLGTEVEVLEESGSQHATPGDLLFAKIVAIEGVALMEACAPVLLSPQEKIPVIELRRKMASARTGLSGVQLLREYDHELRELLLTLSERRLNPSPPAMCNTDGDPLEFHTLRFDLADATEAAIRLRDLAAGVEDSDFEVGLERDAAGRVVRAEFPWLRIEAPDAATQNTVLGHLRIEARRLTAEVNSAKRAAALRRLIEVRLPQARVLPTVVQSSQAFIEEAHERAMTGAFLSRDEETERFQRLPEIQAALRETVRRHYRSWPDEPLPALGGRTPRQAIGDPDGRDAVEALLRQFERDMVRHDPAANAGIVDELRAALGMN
jgi:hypothetical protein